MVSEIESLGLVQLLRLEAEIENVHRDVYTLNRSAGSSNHFEREAALTRELLLHKARVACLYGMGVRIKLHDSFKEMERLRPQPFVPNPPASH